MGLFSRKTIFDEDVLRCPACGERVPDGRIACAMCGRDLADVVKADGLSRTSDAKRVRR